MKIDDKAEEVARELFGFAIRAELDDFEAKITKANVDILTKALQLSVAVAGAVVLHIGDGQQPSDADFRKLADTAASVEKRYELKSDEAFMYLSRVVFGGQPLDEVFSPGEAATLPFLITGNLLASYRDVREGQKWWEYLDEIEAAIEAAPDPS